MSLLPIGAYEPKKFMCPIHMSPYDAVQAHQDVMSKFSIGMHWKTFHLSDEPVLRPPYDLYRAIENASLDHKDFVVIDHGDMVNW